MHKVIIIPGLGDDLTKLRWVTRHWIKYGLEPILYNIQWRSGEKHFKHKLDKLIKTIDDLNSRGDKISLLGTSAGGSAVVNVFCSRKNKIHKVINVCGRLRKGDGVYPTLDFTSRSSLAFKESVLLCEKNQKSISDVDSKRILTIRPLFDETVPISTTTLYGARNDQIFSIGHVFSIALSMTLLSKRLINFLLCDVSHQK